MELSARNRGKAVVHAFIHLIPYEAGSKPFRPVELEKICLRLGMSVGQVSGPVSPVVEHLAQYHVGFRADVVVENRIDPALRHISKFSHAGISPGSVLRCIQTAFKFSVVAGALHQDLRLLPRFHLHFHTGTHMQAPRPFREHILPADCFLLPFPGKCDASGEEKDRRLLAFPVKCPGFPGFHMIHADIHHHSTIFIVVRGKDHLAVFVKFRIAEYFVHLKHLPFCCRNCRDPAIPFIRLCFPD